MDTCSRHCAGLGKPCSFISGVCDQGCVAGYQGDLCRTGEPWQIHFLFNTDTFLETAPFCSPANANVYHVVQRTEFILASCLHHTHYLQQNVENMEEEKDLKQCERDINLIHVILEQILMPQTRRSNRKNESMLDNS